MSRSFRRNPNRWQDEPEPKPKRGVVTEPRAPRCGRTQKIKFKTHAMALTRAGEILANPDDRTPQGFRAYLCSFCQGYHLAAC